MGVPPWKHVGLVVVAVRMTMIVMVAISMIAVMTMIMVCVMRVCDSRMMIGRVVNSVMAVIPEFRERANEAKAFDPKQPRAQ
jgi:hypothetical protein